MRYLTALLLSTLMLLASDAVTIGNLQWQDNQAAKTKQLNWEDSNLTFAPK